MVATIERDFNQAVSNHREHDAAMLQAKGRRGQHRFSR